MESNKVNNLVKAYVLSTTSTLGPLVNFIYDHEEAFLDEFRIVMRATELLKVSFNDESCYFDYYSSEGTVVADMVPIEDLIEWIVSLDIELTL